MQVAYVVLFMQDWAQGRFPGARGANQHNLHICEINKAARGVEIDRVGESFVLVKKVGRKCQSEHCGIIQLKAKVTYSTSMGDKTRATDTSAEQGGVDLNVTSELRRWSFLLVRQRAIPSSVDFGSELSSNAWLAIISNSERSRSPFKPHNDCSAVVSSSTIKSASDKRLCSAPRTVSWCGSVCDLRFCIAVTDNTKLGQNKVHSILRRDDVPHTVGSNHKDVTWSREHLVNIHHAAQPNVPLFDIKVSQCPCDA